MLTIIISRSIPCPACLLSSFRLNSSAILFQESVSGFCFKSLFCFSHDEVFVSEIFFLNLL